MQRVFKTLVGQFNQFLSGLSPVKRMSMVVAVGIVVAAVGVVLFLVSGSNYSVLFRNVSSDQLPVVINKLQQKNVPFRLEDDGSTVLVPKDLLYSTQMAVMSELGTSDVGNIGLEIFDKQDFGITSYAQRINYQRALQGELIRAINTLSAVKQSKVILALPPKKTFLEEGGEPSASVIIELQSGKALTAEQVKGITSLVSSSVEGLMEERVTVVDSRGKILSKQYSAESGASGELLDLKRRVETQFEERVESMLSRVVGSGKVIAKVDATLNPQAVSMVQETVDPDSTALRSSMTEEELLDGARTNPAGIPGARANLPGANDQGQVGFRQNVRKEIKQNNFSVPKTVKNVKESAGALRRLSVAVLVDGKTIQVTGEDGDVKEQWNPRTSTEMDKYTEIVKNAIGFNAQRGDSIKIENIQFETEDFGEATEILTSLEKRKLLHSLFKWSLLGFGLALFFFVVVRPFMRWITDSFQDSVEDMLPRTIEELEELQSADNTLPGMSGALPVLEDSIDPDKAESELLKERIMALLESDEEKAAGAFSLWVARRDS